MQSKLRLCHCKLRLPAILTASQKYSCKQAFLLHGRIAGSLQGKLRLCHCKLRLPAILTASQKYSCKQAFLLHGRIAGSLQGKLRLCHCKLRLPAILTASQKYSCKQAFLLHGRIAGSLQSKPVHIRFVENNFAFSAARKKHKDTFLFSYFCMTKRRAQGGVATSERRRRDRMLEFWRKFWCEHSKMGFILIIHI